MIIETDRLILRHFRETDADDVHLYASDPVVCEHTDWGPNAWQDTVDFVARASAHPAESLADMAITLRGNVQAVGGCGAFVPRGEDPDERPHVREIGWVLRRDLWGQGIMTEAMRAVIDHLMRHHPDITRLESRTRPANQRSERVMKNLGMSLEFTLEREFESKGQWVDSVLYSLDLRPLRDTWPASAPWL